MTHVRREDLDRFVQGQLEPEVRTDLLAHVLSGCAPCQELARHSWGLELPARKTGDLGRFAKEDEPRVRQASSDLLRKIREEESKMALENSQAPGLLQELKNQPHARRVTLVRNAARFQTWALAELLIHGSLDLMFSAPQEGLEMAEIGLAVADCLDETRYGQRLLSDLRGRAWAHVGNAHRVLGHLIEAREAFSHAGENIEKGTGDPIEEARLAEFTAYLDGAQSRFAEANRLLDRAARLYASVGDLHQEGRILDNLGVLAAQSGNPDAAVKLGQQALEKIDPEHEPRTWLAAQHNLIYHLHDLGRNEEARSALQRLRPVYVQQDERMNLLRLTWLEGKIEQALRQYDEAEKAFLDVRKAFVAESLPFDVALASLDLATLYLEQHRTRETKRVAVETMTLLQSLGIEREALAAWVIFKQAAETEALSVAFLAQLAAYFGNARANPQLKFAPAL